MIELNPRQFLLLGGIILLALGVLGMFGLGPDSDSSILGSFFWLDQTENVAHLVLGAVALGTYYMVKDEMLTLWLVRLVGVVAAVVAVLGFMSAGNPEPNVGVSNLENPADNVLHLVVAVWALWVGFMNTKSNA